VIAASFVRVAAAAVTLTPTRTQALYSTSVDPDCSKLVKTADADLPFNIVRLRVAVDGTPAGLGYHWSMPKKSKGTLAADLDLTPGVEESAVSGMCAEFGNACVLTEQKLRFYTEPSILWLAPTCDVLPGDTSKPFAGGTSHVKVKVTAGKRKLGKATATIQWGRTGSVTLFVEDFDGMFQDGRRKREVATGFNAVFATQSTAPNLTPGPGPIKFYDVDNGGGGSASLTPGSCGITGFDACERLDYPAAGRFLATVTARFADQSALCDNLNVRVLACAPKAQLEIIPRPKLQTYDPKSPRSTVDLTIRLHNRSQSRAGLPPCPFLLSGANVLTCDESLKVGNVTDSKGTSFDLRHCSMTKDRPCDDDTQCRPPVCLGCEADETCLTQAHCSKHVEQLCGNDHDCDPDALPAVCPNCDKDETCVRVLDLGVGGEVRVEPGQSIDLFHQTVTLRNVLPATASIVDTWTATTENAGTASAKLKYKVRGRP